MVFEKVKQIIAEELSVELEDIKMNTHLTDDLGADSLDAVELIMTIEEEFEVEIPDDELQNIQTVADIVEYLDNHA